MTLEAKKANVLFYSTVIIFLTLVVVLIKNFDLRRANDYKEYVVILTNVVNRDNDKIRFLYGQLVAQQKVLIAQQKENDGLRNVLTETRNDLDALSNKFAKPIATAAPDSIPAPATTPLAAASATK